MLSIERVKTIAHLARLELNDEELNHLCVDLNSITKWIEDIEKLDLSQETFEADPDPFSSPQDPQTVAQDGEFLLANVPDRRGSYVAVPLVME